ncbi:MAG: hypothetical protein Q8P26_04525 [Candidatus Levybacteria bacterium]|nr:hypothetical protein [Candidatus Levybacteria bacterium]
MKILSRRVRLVGLPIRKKFLSIVFLTGALLLATTPSGAGAAKPATDWCLADRHQNRIGQIGGNWPIPQVSQSTATTYLTELTKSGRLKSEKKAKATVYKS